MKTKFLPLTCIFFCFFIYLKSAYSQKITTIPLDKKVYMLYSYNPKAQNAFASMLDSARKASANGQFLAGDYSDSNTKFRLVILPPLIGTSAAHRAYTFYVTPYKCDFVYVSLPSISSIETTAISSSAIIGVGKRKFKATVVSDDEAVQIMDVSNEHITSDIRLFENKLPSLNFPLINGGNQSLTSFEHQDKLIYLHFWCSPDNKSCTANLDTLKEVFNAYKNSINIVSLFYPEGCGGDKTDTIQVKKVITDKQLQWMQGFGDLALAANLFVTGNEYGMLFDEDGNVLKMFILPGELKAYLKKKYGE